MKMHARVTVANKLPSRVRIKILEVLSKDYNAHKISLAYVSDNVTLKKNIYHYTTSYIEVSAYSF